MKTKMSFKMLKKMHYEVSPQLEMSILENAQKNKIKQHYDGRREKNEWVGQHPLSPTRVKLFLI